MNERWKVTGSQSRTTGHGESESELVITREPIEGRTALQLIVPQGDMNEVQHAHYATMVCTALNFFETKRGVV